MAIYQIVVTRVDTIQGELIFPTGNQFNVRTVPLTSIRDGTPREPDTEVETVVYEQRKEMDLDKIIMAVNGYTRTK